MQSQADVLRNWVLSSLLQGEVTPVVERLQQTWSDSTWAGRRTVARLASGALGVTLGDLLGTYPELATVSFLSGLEEKLASSSIKLSTAHKYVTSFRGLMNLLPTVPRSDLQILTDYARALLRQGASLATTVALPLPLKCLRSFISDASVPLDLRSALFVAWKTASRWDDIVGLPLPFPSYPSNSQLLVAFLNNTKESQARPFEPRFLCLIDWSDKRGTAPTREIYDYLTQQTDGTLASRWSTSQVELFLKRIPLEAHPHQAPLLPNQRFNTHYTAHSIKKGAVKHLWEQALVNGMDPIIIERISKHKNPGGEPLSATALRYAPSLYPVALLLKTHEASRIL